MAKSLIPHGGNDIVYTPKHLAETIVGHFASQIKGMVLEPCAGGGAFVHALKKIKCNIDECEISRGKDFFQYNKKVDWIVTNPPWSKARDFAKHAYSISNDIVFLITINHFTGLRARRVDMQKAGFAIKEILTVKQPPKPWPQSGFDLGAIHFKRDWRGHTKWSNA